MTQLFHPFRVSVLGAMALVALVALGFAGWKARERIRFCRERAEYHAAREVQAWKDARWKARFAKRFEDDALSLTALSQVAEAKARYHSRLTVRYEWLASHPWLLPPQEQPYDEEVTLAILTEALREDPSNVDLLRIRATMSQRRGQYDQAIADLKRGIAVGDSKSRLSGMREMLAWIHATCPIARYRDGQEALRLASEAYKFWTFAPFRFTDSGSDEYRGDYSETGQFLAWNSVHKLIALEIMAASNAESGRFTDAVECENNVLRHLVDPSDRRRVLGRRQLYEERRPLRTRESLYEALGLRLE